MKTNISPILAALAVSVLSVNTSLQAQDPPSAASSVVGFTTINLIAGNASTPPTQLIGLGMSQPSALQLRVATVSGASLTFAENTITENAYNPVSGRTTHFLEVVSGAGAGILSHILSTGTDALVLEDDISAALVAGETQVRIRRFWTVSEAFGAENSAGFLGAASSAAADVITITRPDDDTLQIFFNTGSNRWETTSSVDASDLPIPVDAGISVLRRGTTATSFVIAGEVKTGPTALWIAGSTTPTTTVLQNPYPTGSVMLKDSGLFTGDPATGVIGGTSVNNADLVAIRDPQTGETNQFFFDNNSNRWKTGFTDASLIKIPENASISITRRANGSGFNWFSPQPVMALGTETLPLNLISAASRKTHGTAGTWDVNLPFGGSLVGVEPRTGGTNGDHTLVFKFSGSSSSNPITSATVGIQSGVGTIVGSPIFTGDTITVNLTGVLNAQTLQIAISDVIAQNGQAFASATVPFAALRGDTSNNGSVTIQDINQNRSVATPNPVGLPVFRGDVNLNGTITIADINLARAASGTSSNPID